MSASMFTLCSMVPAFWMENNPLKCLPVYIRLYGVTFHKTRDSNPWRQYHKHHISTTHCCCPFSDFIRIRTQQKWIQK